MLKSLLLTNFTNYTNMRSNFMDYWQQGYMAAMGFIFWPMVFMTIIGYTYIKMRSATVAVGAILIVFVTFGNIFTGVNVWITLLYILVSLGFTGLLLAFIIKRRGVS